MLVRLVGEDWAKDVKDLDIILKGNLVNFLKHEQFKGQEGEVQSFYSSGYLPVKTVLILGMGKDQDFSLNQLRVLIAKVTKIAKKTNKKSLAIDVTHHFLSKESVQNVVKTITEGIILGNYKFNKYLASAQKQDNLEEVSLLVSPDHIQHAANGVDLGSVYAQATNFARDLINEPAKITTPTYLANVAKALAKREGYGIEIWDEKEIKKKGMEAFAAIAQGSDQPLKFIKLTFRGSGSRLQGKKKITLIGKGLTFDSGGLSLKDAKNMETMKLDMSGAAAVLGIFSVLGKLKPKASVVGLIPACENMPGPKAVKPGDIVKAYNGKTIEILNTDAEGRLTLADALSYAVSDKSDMIIDLATLTGACIVALGEDIAGLFSNNDELKRNLLKSSQNEGEKFWELPLEKNYTEAIKSDIADIKNVGKKGSAGAITAALFLQEFVGKVPWVHLDIAGPAYAEKESPLSNKGGTGFAVRTLLNFLQNL